MHILFVQKCKIILINIPSSNFTQTCSLHSENRTHINIYDHKDQMRDKRGYYNLLFSSLILKPILLNLYD